MDTLEWKSWKPSQLSTKALYDILELRSRVFVVEQECAYLDPDGQDLDDGVVHIAAYNGDKLVAYARIIPRGPEFSHDIRIGRVVTDPSCRGGLGSKLVAEVVRQCKNIYPNRRMTMGAQAHLQKFYGKFGFTKDGNEYDEDGIMHIDMIGPQVSQQAP